MHCVTFRGRVHGGISSNPSGPERQGESHAYGRQLKEVVPRQSSGQVIVLASRPNGSRWTISIPLASRESAANFAGTDECILLAGVRRPNGKFGLKPLIKY